MNERMHWWWHGRTNAHAAQHTKRTKGSNTSPVCVGAVVAVCKSGSRRNILVETVPPGCHEILPHPEARGWRGRGEREDVGGPNRDV